MKNGRRFLVRLLLGVMSGWFGLSLAEAQEWTEQPTDDCLPEPLIAWWRGRLEGYTQSPSIAQGEYVRFKVSALDAYIQPDSVRPVECAMEIYRAAGRTMAGDVLMTTRPNFYATFYPLHDSVGDPIWPNDYTRLPRDYRTGCHWATVDSLEIPTNWPSGFYYAKLFLPGNGLQNPVGYIPFVVRAAVPGRSSKTLCVIAWNTYQAYNYWGGGSLYYWTGVFGSEDTTAGGGRIIRTVSFRRPFTVHSHCGFPTTNQLGQFDVIYEDQQLGLALWNRLERSFVAWAEEMRDTMEFCVDADVNANVGGFLSNYRSIVFAGHSEYWSRPQRQKIEKGPAGTDFISGGGNVAFFAANNCYWKVDYFPRSPASNNPDSMYCDKEWTDQAPGGASLWRRQIDSTTGQYEHEARFIGVEFMGTNAPQGNYPNIVQRENHWIFRGTGLQNNVTFGRGNPDHPYVMQLAGGEVDRTVPQVSPSNIEVLGRVFIRTMADTEAHYGDVPDHTIFSDCAYDEDTGTNSRIFAGGGNGWQGCLFGQDSIVMRTITASVFDHFCGRKYVGNIYAALLEWNHDRLGRDTVEIDGEASVLAGKQLRVGNGMRVIIDSAVTLFVDGELQIPSSASVTLSGSGSTWGNLVINNGGVLRLKSNSTLTISSSAYFVLENGGDVVFESGASLILNNAVFDTRASLVASLAQWSASRAGAFVATPAAHSPR